MGLRATLPSTDLTQDITMGVERGCSDASQVGSGGRMQVAAVGGDRDGESSLHTSEAVRDTRGISASLTQGSADISDS